MSTKKSLSTSGVGEDGKVFWTFDNSQFKSKNIGLNEHQMELAKIPDIKEKFLRAYHDFKSSVSKACSIAHVHRKTFLKWKNTDQDFRDRMDEIDESFVDMAQEELIKIVRGKKKLPTTKIQFEAIVYFLNKKGKAKGYGLGTEEADPVVNINIIDNNAHTDSTPPPQESKDETRKDEL